MHLKNFTLELLQEQTGIASTRISVILNGHVTISERTISLFAKALGVSPAEAYAQIEEVRAEKRLKKSRPISTT